MGTRKCLCIICLLLGILTPMRSFAQVTFYLSAKSDKEFDIEGDDLNPHSGVELRIIYDSQSLSNPLVSLAQGTLIDVSDSAGTLIVRALQGEDSTASFLLHLSFDKRDDLPGKLFSVNGSVTDPDGSFSTTRTLPGTTDSQSVLLSWDGDRASAEEEGDSGVSPEILSSERNVLKRFMNFKGKRGGKALLALFDRSPGEGFLQDPAVVLSDGKTPVRISFSLAGGGEAPDVALSDAKLLRVAREAENWVITALPGEGSFDASLIVKLDGRIFEYPLVVAPPVNLGKGVNEKDFLPELDRFLFDRIGPAKGENHSIRYALLEYVFTANYLADLQKAPLKTASGRTNPTGDHKQ